MAYFFNGLLKGDLGDKFYYIGRNGGQRSVDKELKKQHAARLGKRSLEFARAAEAVLLFTTAFSGLIEFAGDITYEGRLQRHMLEVIRSDGYAPIGLRTIMDGDLSILEGFECDEKSPLPVSLQGLCEVSPYRKYGNLDLYIPSFDPAVVLPAIECAAFFRIDSVMAAINFDTGDCSVSRNVFVEWPIDGTMSPDIAIEHKVEIDRYIPWFLFVGLQIDTIPGYKCNSSFGGSYRALRLIKVFANDQR
jgi:hypothetical protein